MGYNRNSLPSASSSGGLALTVENIDGTGTPYTLEAGKSYLCNLSQICTLDLPASPADGDTVEIVDAGGNFATYNVTVDGGTNNLQDAGATTDTLSTNKMKVQFTWVAAVSAWITRDVS